MGTAEGINYEVLGTSIPILHGHVHVRNDPGCAYSDGHHGEVRAKITAELRKLMGEAY